MTALLMVIIFLMLILPHELAHFIVARVSGMRVDRLSVGFGPKIWSIKRKGTEYALRLFPIGGYVNIAGMDRSKQGAGDGFYSKSVPRQLAVVIAGSVMNFVLAILLFAVVFMVGYQAVDLERATVGGVISGSPAEEAGLVAGDRIVSIDGRQIETWPQISQYLDGSAEQVYELVVLRDTCEIAFAVTPRYYPEYDRKLVGISPPTILVRYDPITAIGSGGKQVILVMGAIVDSLWSCLLYTSDAATN